MIEHGAAPQSDRPMLTYSEVWPLGADEVSLWLLEETGPWPSNYIHRQTDPLTVAEIELIQHSVNLGRSLLHSTSWRIDYDPDTDQNFGVYTFMAVIPVDGLVLDRWPDAKPITVDLADQAGRAPRHGPTELPEVPHWFVLLHGLRHLRFLRETDSDVLAALNEHWCRHLEAFAPAIARMYV
jgi:hypothetical protein